jgi:hypothetical protein
LVQRQSTPVDDLTRRRSNSMKRIQTLLSSDNSRSAFASHALDAQTIGTLLSAMPIVIVAALA